MVKSKVIEKDGGARLVYQGGRFYVVPDDEAQALIDEGAVVDPEVQPPAVEPAPEIPPGEAGAGAEDGGSAAPVDREGVDS